MGKLVICGDSFNIGIGVHDLKKEPYGSLLAEKLNKELINFAKGSSTNFSILLQVKYALENVKDIDLLCLSVTSYNRVDWFPYDTQLANPDIKLTDVNYHQYPPFGKDTYQYLLENPLQNDPNYVGKMFTENYFGVVDYVDNIMNTRHKTGNYFAKFRKEPDEKMKVLRDFYAEIFDEKIQRQFDIGIINMAHMLLKKNNIKHCILTWDIEFANYIDKQYLVNVDWHKLAIDFPDDLNTLHTSKEGHIKVYNDVLNKLKKNNWI
jgi:hypothetical protein